MTVHFTNPDGFFPSPDRNPYYIVTPPYTRRSAGIRTLHFLCHALNSVGQSAFLFFDRQSWPQTLEVNPEFLTPVLTQDIINYHFERSRCPIVVYPEIISGNPLAAPMVVRYLLNFPGLLGGDRSYDHNEIRFGYSGVLARAAGSSDDNVLFVPISDTRVFHPRPEIQRTLVSFHAKKYKMLESDPTFCHPDDAIEITDHMMPDEIADIFTRSKLFYCYENSALALEAGLCNCPTVFIKNKNFTDLIADPEDSQDGVAFSDDPAEIEMARLSVGSIYPKFIAAQKTFWHQLDHFVTLTQQHAARRTYPTKISIDTFEKREIKRSASSRKTPLQSLLAKLARRPIDYVR